MYTGCTGPSKGTALPKGKTMTSQGDSPLRKYPASWIASADQECAKSKDFVEQLIEAHRIDMELYKESGLGGQMETIGLLGANILLAADGNEITREAIGFLLATAIDKLARLPKEVTDPNHGLPQ